jgi:hypothetical protein
MQNIYNNASVLHHPEHKTPPNQQRKIVQPPRGAPRKSKKHRVKKGKMIIMYSTS